MSTAPAVASIVIPTYNQVPAYLAAAITSAADQTCPVQIIIVDDGSTVPVGNHADVVNAITSAKATLIRHDLNRGISYAINSGIGAVETEWFAWLSSDDLFYPTKIAHQIASLQSVNGFAGYHAYHQQSGGELTLSLTPIFASASHQRRALSRDCWINGSTVLLHRSVIAEVGGPSISYRYSQDWEWWCRIGLKYRWHAVPCAVCAGRIGACPHCYGQGVAVLGARRIDGRSLTNQIQEDPKLQAVRDDENRRIRRAFRPGGRCPR